MEIAGINAFTGSVSPLEGLAPLHLRASEVAAAGSESYPGRDEIPAFRADFGRQLVDLPTAVPRV